MISLFISDPELMALLEHKNDAAGKALIRSLELLGKQHRRPFPCREPLLGNRRYRRAVMQWLDDWQRVRAAPTEQTDTWEENHAAPRQTGRVENAGHDVGQAGVLLATPKRDRKEGMSYKGPEVVAIDGKTWNGTRWVDLPDS